MRGGKPRFRRIVLFLSLIHILDDLSLKFLKPEVYYDLVEKVDLRKDAREAFVQSIVDEVKAHLDEAWYDDRGRCASHLHLRR